ncbi:protein KINESIN LIGHT CHAIN-RELATED [Salix suchowensis]|nr:protein KINESIN LIGHT CHAIN-RELATED [Salix suchowensis]
MRGLTMDVLNGDEYRRVDDDDTIGDFVFFKGSGFSHQMIRSPRSTLSQHSPRSDSIDLALMQSSDPSPSKASFLSSGEESKIDSELCHLAGDTAKMEITEEVTISENVGGGFSESGASARLTPKSTSHKNPPNDGQTLDKKIRKPKAVFAWKKRGRSASALAKFQIEIDQNLPQTAGVDNPDPGPFLLRLTRDMSRLCLNLHVLGAIHCSLGQYNNAIPYLERSIEIPVMEDGQNQALTISGCMQLGDTYAMLGQIENSILCYTAGLEIQRQVLGETDPQVGDTCRYVAEAHVHALQFDEAENLCQIALDINREKGGPAATLEEAEDRRLMGFIRDAKGNNESALEHYVLASMAMAGNYEQKMFDEARSILKKKYGPPHPDCSGQVRTLLDDAIEILDCVVGMWEKKLGAANPDVDDEKQWLVVELLKEAGRVRNPYH